MNQELKYKIQKIHELINRGATEGEKQAAKKALDRLISKHNLDETMLSEINSSARKFYYGSICEQTLIVQIIRFFASDCKDSIRRGTKHIICKMQYVDYITVDSAYEYFRRHMKAQWKLLCADQLNTCRKAKTKNKKRKYLQDIFLTQYLIKSKLVEQKELTTVTVKSHNEMRDRAKMRQIEGGVFNHQIGSNYLLEN